MLTYQYFVSRINSTESQGADEGLSKLRSLFAAQMLVFNNVNYGQGPIPDDLGKTISLAEVSYRVRFLSISAYFEVIIPLYSAWIFAVFAVFMCIWCLVFTGCLFVQTPDSSQFPEVDLGSKLIGPQSQQPSSLCKVLRQLNGAPSSKVIDTMREKQVFIRQSQGVRGTYILMLLETGSNNRK